MSMTWNSCSWQEIAVNARDKPMAHWRIDFSWGDIWRVESYADGQGHFWLDHLESNAELMNLDLVDSCYFIAFNHFMIFGEFNVFFVLFVVIFAENSWCKSLLWTTCLEVTGFSWKLGYISAINYAVRLFLIDLRRKHIYMSQKAQSPAIAGPWAVIPNPFGAVTSTDFHFLPNNPVPPCKSLFLSS